MMERPSLKQQCFCLLAVSFVFAASSAHSAENIENTRILSFTGNPVIVSAGRTPLPVNRQIKLQSDMQIQTGPRDSVLIQFSPKKGCQFLLGPDSLLEFKRAETPFGGYRAYLRRGALSCRAALCQAILDLETSIGRLRGHNSRFSVRVVKDTTTVFLISGGLRLFIGGESFPLREMTRITISNSGSHRIASIGEVNPGTPTLAPPMAFQNNDLPLSGISPVSATKRP
jgi:hypothetical protein